MISHLFDLEPLIHPLVHNPPFPSNSEFPFILPVLPVDYFHDRFLIAFPESKRSPHLESTSTRNSAGGRGCDLFTQNYLFLGPRVCPCPVWSFYVTSFKLLPTQLPCFLLLWQPTTSREGSPGGWSWQDDKQGRCNRIQQILWQLRNRSMTRQGCRD